MNTTSYIPFARLREVLRSCGYFNDFRDLRGFLTSHNYLKEMWQKDFRDQQDMDKQIDQMLEFLLNQKSRISQENALVLFLRVLLERIDRDHYNYGEILVLLDEVEQALGVSRAIPLADSSVVASDLPYTDPYAPYVEPATIISHHYTAPQANLQTASYPAVNGFSTVYYDTALPAASIQPMTAMSADEEWQQYAPAIGLVVVPRMVNGKIKEEPKGIGWLITPDLLLTGWRIANRNHGGKAVLKPTDLLLQLANSFALFDEGYSAQGTKYRVQRLEYYCPTLDYALLRLKDRADIPLVDRGVLKVNDDAWRTIPSELFIIQYPKKPNKQTVKATYLKGDSKTKRILYQADSVFGVYGAPVLDMNRLVVVALHNGKNRPPQHHKGTLLSVILEDLAEHKTGLYQEIKSVGSRFLSL